MSGLAIDGNTVHGVAVSGNSFIPLVKNSDGTYTIRGKKFVQKSDLIGKTATYYENTQYYLIGSKSTANPSEQHYGATSDDSKIVGICELDGEDYVILQQVWNTDGIGAEGMFKLSDITIGGVNSPLIHLYQYLRSLLEEVIAWV